MSIISQPVKRGESEPIRPIEMGGLTFWPCHVFPNIYVGWDYRYHIPVFVGVLSDNVRTIYTDIV